MAKGITIKKLKELLELHKLWLEGDEKGKRLDLSNRDLTNSKVIEILSDANLSYANLKHAIFRHADLCDANLSCSDLSYSDLSYVNLSFADLKYADLSYAYLSHAVLRYADLSYSDLWYAYLCYADLRYVNLSYADLKYAKELPFIPFNCPDTGAFIGWKKVNDYIIKLEIPEKAKRCSATSRKCRCEFAKVLEIQNKDGTNSGLTKILNTNEKELLYKVGKIVYPDSFDEDRWNECSHGIHFFINRQEAVDY